MNTVLPEPLSRWQYLSYIKETSPGKEWHAECPVCGEAGHEWKGKNDYPDRFHMHAPDHIVDAWHGACRRCGYFSVAEENDWQPPKTFYTQSEIKRLQQEQNARREYERRESARMKQKIDWLRHEEFWKGFNKGMGEKQRSIWREAGIPDPMQDRLQLGYVEDKKTYVDGQLIKLPALTIPYFDAGWKVTNLQYRLMCGDMNGDRYRFTSGLRAPAYLTDPDRMPRGKVLVCEGAKKAIVVYLKVVLELGKEFDVIAFPSKTPNEYQLSWLREARAVYLGLDPDAHGLINDGSGATHVSKAAEMIGAERTMVVSWPDKPDDLITGGHATGQDLFNIIAQARRV